MENISKQVYGDANKKFDEFHGDGSNTGEINVYNNSVTNGHKLFQNFTENGFIGSKKVEDHAKSIGGLFAWIRKLSLKDSNFANIKFKAAWGNGNPEVKMGDIQLLEPNKGYSKSWGGELQVEGNAPAKKILATIKTINGDLKTTMSGHSDNLPLFWEIWDARETAGSAKGGLQEDQAETICNSIKNQAIASDNQGDMLAALDTLMFATQIFPLPNAYKTPEVIKYFDRIALLESQKPRSFKDIIPTPLEKPLLLEARKKWLDDLTTEIIDKYITDIYAKASAAIDYQNFNFRKLDGSKFSDKEIKSFYSDQGVRNSQGKLTNFTLGNNLEQIKKDVAKSLKDFQNNVDEIRKAYSDEFEATYGGKINKATHPNAKVVEPWAKAVDNGAQVIGDLLESRIKNLNNKIEAKIDEKSDYLSDLFREADFYIKHDKPLPTFLLDPANSYTELGIVYKEKVPQELDGEGKPETDDPLFKGKNDGEVIARLATFRFDLTGYPAEDLKKSGFDVTKTETVIRDEKKNTIKTKDKAHVFYGMNNRVNDIKNVKFFIKDSDLKEVNDKISAFGISFKKHDTENYYQVQGDFNDEVGLENYFKSDREKIEIEKTYWTLTANNPNSVAEQAEDIKKLFLSAPGRPRQVPNIYIDNNDGLEPQQIYSREFLAVYQKGLVDEIKDAAKNNKDNKVQVNKCYFFTGEGKTHVIQRITNDIKFRKQADALLGLGGTSNDEIVVLDFNLQNDDVQEIKKKIVIETLLSIDPKKEYGDLLKLKDLSELITELGSKKGNKKFNFIIQADEDPHMRRKVKQTLYNIHDFLTEECKLIKAGSPNDSLGSINLISISGTPKQKRHDHLVDKIIGYVDSKEWFEKNGNVKQGKKFEYTNTETGKKEIRALENFQAAYKNIAGLFDQNALDRADDKSIEDRIVKNISAVVPIKKYHDDKGNEVINARHIQYLMPDLSAMDSALLFAPTRLEELVRGILNQPSITGKNDFFVLLPPVADSVAKEIRNKAGDLSKLTPEQRNYIDLLEKKKIVQFKKEGSEWKLASIVEGLEKELDKEENSKKDSICFYDQNTVVGGDYGKFSRDVTDFYIDDLSGREFGTDDLAQWIARNRTMNLRDDSIVGKVKNQCSFYYAGKPDNLARIKNNADKSAYLVNAQLEVINASESEMENKIKNYKNNARDLIKPANDNDLTPLKKITERLNRLKLSGNQISEVIQELDFYADKNPNSSRLFNSYDKENILDNLFELAVFPYGKKLNGADSDEVALYKTANLYVKEYIEQKRAIRPDEDKSVDLKLFKGRAADKGFVPNDLSTKLESVDKDIKLKDYFYYGEIKVGSRFFGKISEKKEALKKHLNIDQEKSILPNYTIIDLIRLKNEDNYSSSDIRNVIRANKQFNKYLEIALDEVNTTLEEFQKDIVSIEEILGKDVQEKKLPKEEINYLKGAIPQFEHPDKIKFTLVGGKNVLIPYDPNSKNIFKDLKDTLNKLDEVKRLSGDLQDIRSSLINNDSSLNSAHDRRDQLAAKAQDILNDGDIGNIDASQIKQLKKDFADFEKFAKKDNQESALAILPNNIVEKAKSDPEKLKRLADIAKTIDNKDNLPLVSVIDKINLIEDDNYFLFSKKERDELLGSTENGKKNYLIEKLSSCLDIPKVDFDSGTSAGINIKVQKDGKVKISHGSKSTTAEINVGIKNIIEEKSETTEVLDKHKTKLEDFHKKLKSKRNAPNISKSKISLYYVNQSDVQEDDVDASNPAYRGTIPHLVLENSSNKVVTDIALSKQAYREELTYLTNTENNLKEYLATGLNSNAEANRVFSNIISTTNSFRKEEKAKIKEFGDLPLIPLKPENKNNFANSLERNGTRVKISFMTDYFEPSKDSNKLLPKNWPEDAPTIRYVQVNGTGIAGMTKPLKLKFGLNKETGNLEYQGIYRYIDNLPVSVIDEKEITSEEKKLIKQMKVLAAWQMPSKIASNKQVVLKQAVFFDGETVDFMVKKTAKDLELGSIANSFNIANNNTHIVVDNAELKIKPSPKAMPREVSKLKSSSLDQSMVYN